MITGGNRGLGLEITQKFNATSYSRSNGYDITDPIHRQALAMISLEHDVFINNAFDGPFQESWADFGQVKLLWDVANLWKTQGKPGYIINIGSVGSNNVVSPDPSWETYRVSKHALRAHSQQWTRAFKQNQVAFRTSILTLDRLDTELSRSRDNWTGNGIDLRDVCAYIQIMLDSSPNTCIEEIVSWVNLDHKQ